MQLYLSLRIVRILRFNSILKKLAINELNMLQELRGRYEELV